MDLSTPGSLSLQDEFQKAVAQQKRILRTQRARLPDVNKHVDRAEKKVRWFEAKDASYEAMRKERAQLVKESEGSAARLKVVREKMGKIEEAISKLRSIYNLKVSTSTLKKVFHNLQFQCRSHMMRRERSLPSITLSSREKTMDEEPGERNGAMCSGLKVLLLGVQFGPAEISRILESHTERTKSQATVIIFTFS